MDREAWGAAIHGAARSRTRLSNWTELLKKTEWNRKQVLERIWRNRCPCALLIGWNHYGHSMKVPQKIKNSITAWLNTLTSGYLLKRMHRSPRICKISMKYLHTHVHNSTIPNSQEAEAVHVPTEWMNGLTTRGKYGILLSLEDILTRAMTWTNLEDICWVK